MSLVQTCYSNTEPSSWCTSTPDGGTITKSLYNANGRYGGVTVSATRDTVVRCNVQRNDFFPPNPDSIRIRQPKKPHVVDMDVFPFCSEELPFGMALAMNWDGQDDGLRSKREREEARTRHCNYVQLYAFAGNGIHTLVRQIEVAGKITCMRVLISPPEMEAQKQFLSDRIGAWPSIVAIGCERSSCYLGQFSTFDFNKGAEWPKPGEDVPTMIATTEALRSLNHNGRMHYPVGSSFHKWNKDDVKVTALAYIPCYAVLVVGLSNGAAVMVPLDGKSALKCLTIPHSTPITHLVVLEPEFDPQGGFYVFSARSRPDSNANSPLVIFSHKIARASGGNDGYEYHDMNSVMIPMRDGDRWINVHGIVKPRKRDANTSINTTADSADSSLPLGLNTTQHVHNDGRERTLLFFTYFTKNGEMKGGLFDLNAFYSRRCGTQQVRFDDYGQDPVCSSFEFTLPKTATGQPVFKMSDIASVHCQAATRYVSPIFDRDALFQPMAFKLNMVIHTLGMYGYVAGVDSLQETVLLKMGLSISESLAQPDTALAWLERAGLEHPPIGRRERKKMEERPANERVPAELDKIMRALSTHEVTRRNLIGWIEDCEDRKQLLHAGRWMFNELREIVALMDDLVVCVFCGEDPKQLSKGGKMIYDYCPDFFEFAELFLWKVRARGQELLNDSLRLRHTRKLHALMAFSLRLFFATVDWFTIWLPMSKEWPTDLLMDVRTLNEERKEKAEDHPLFINALLGRLFEKTMEDECWAGMTDPTEWYPPTRFNLASLMRQNEAAIEDRVALMMYYLMDVDEAVKRNNAKPKEQRKECPVKMSLLHWYMKDALKDLLAEEQSTAAVRERWEEDMKGKPIPPPAPRPPSPGELSEEEKKECQALITHFNRWVRMQKVDEDRLRTLLMKLPYGEYRYNLLLIKGSRFIQVNAELPKLPGWGPEYPHRAVQDYFKYQGLARQQKTNYDQVVLDNAHRMTISGAPFLNWGKPKPAPAEEEENKTVDQSCNVARHANVTIRAKTPKKLLFNRLAPPAAPLGLIATPPPAPSADVARINALMKTPAMRFHMQTPHGDEKDDDDHARNDSDVAPDEMARVREALRTPRSRATAAARTAGDATATTPEAAPRPAMAPPTSILKSGGQRSRLPPVASGMRLRFANVFEQKSISPIDRDTSASTGAYVNQPNFDDSFDDNSDELPTSRHSTPKSLTATTRLEREIEEEEERRRAEDSVNVEAEESEGASVESAESAPLSMIDVGEEGEQLTEEKMEEDGMDEEEEEAAGDGGGGTFTIYRDNDAATTGDEADRDTVAPSDAAVLTPPLPTEVAARAATLPAHPDDDDDDDAEKNLSRAVTPEEEEEEVEDVTPIEEQEEAAEANQQQILEEPEKEEGEGGGVEEEHSHAAAAVAAVVDAVEKSEATASPGSSSPHRTLNETFTVVNATFAVQVMKTGEEGDAPEGHSAAPPTAAAALQQPVEEDEEATPAAPASASDESAAAAARDEEQKDDNVSRAVTPVEEEEKMEDAPPIEEEQEAVGADVSRAVTPVGEEEEKLEDDVLEPEKEQETPEEEEEADAPAVAAAAAPPVHAARAAAVPPPRPMPRTVFASRAEPIALGLTSYIYMEGGIEKSFEEQRDSSIDEEEEDKEKEEMLARLTRSSSRLQQRKEKGGGEEMEAELAANGIRKRSRGRRDSDKEAAGPSTSKRDRKEEGEKGDAHLLTTTRTCIVEERYVERGDGVLQHTVKQSTKIIEMADGVVVKADGEDRETLEEEGQRVEQLDDADRATPPMVKAAAEPTTGRRTTAASRSRTVSTASKMSTRGQKEEEKKRGDKATTPLRSPSKQVVTRRKLMSDEAGEKKEEKEEPATPRRSSRVRMHSESAVSTVSQTPSKGTRKSPSRAARKTPSRQSSAAPSSPVRLFVVDDAEEEKKKASVVPPKTPSKRGRPRKEPAAAAAADDDFDAEVERPLPTRRTTASAAASLARRRTASETVEQKKKEEEERKKREEEWREEDKIDHIALLRARRDKVKAEGEAMRKAEAARKMRGGKGLSAIPEGKEVSGKKKEDQEEQPSTSQAAAAPRPAARKRTQSETVVVKDTAMKTPSKKKTKVTTEEEKEGEDAADQSMLRRSSRKAAVVKTEVLKTPSKKGGK